MQTVRLADSATAAAYPLPVAAAAAWRPVDGAMVVDIRLPALPSGSILIPSLAVHGVDVAYHRWSLRAGERAWALPAVPSNRATTASAAPDPDVSLHIDCFHVHADLVDAVLTVVASTDQPIDRYLIVVSARPITAAHPQPPIERQALTRPPPALSQMAAPTEIAGRICSPTSVAMVLALWGAREPWLDIVAECRDAATGMYGVWPLATAAAARRGSIGAVEAFSDWQEPLAVLARGVPIIASIRFETGALPEAPLARTAGHLVVVFAAGPDWVGVNDPAAPDTASVTRYYAARAFSQAWLAHRGAAYILPP